MTDLEEQNVRCWLVSAPAAGMAVQCLALAEAMGLSGVRKHVHPRWPWRWLPLPLWWGEAGLRAAGPGSDAIAPPWPDVVIGCGRYGAGVVRAIRRASGGRTATVQIQDPRISPRHFDVVIVPAHDRLRGDNVLVMQGSLHRVTDERLHAEAERFAPTVAHLSRPLATVLIGGPNRAYRLGEREARAIATKLADMSRQQGVSLAITVSRRTGPAALREMRRILDEDHTPHVLWAGEGENPYFGYLGLADYILVTCDSVNMTCEASATGKPVYTIPLPGGSRKFDDFHERMQRDGRTRVFEGVLEPFEPPPLREYAAVAREVWDRLRQRLPSAAF